MLLSHFVFVYNPNHVLFMASSVSHGTKSSAVHLSNHSSVYIPLSTGGFLLPAHPQHASYGLRIGNQNPFL